MKKKILSMFLILVMVLTFAPITPNVMAAEYAITSITNSTFTRDLAIKEDGSLWAFTDVFYDGKSVKITVEKPAKIMDNVVSVSSGDSHHMIIKKDGSLWAFGSNTYGQLGDGTTTERTTPIKIMNDVAFVSTGSDHTAAIKKDGSLWVWGCNNDGQIGDGTVAKYVNHKVTEESKRYSPIKIMDNVTFVSAWGNRTMAVQTDGSLWDWGTRNSFSWTDSNFKEDKRNFRYPVKVMDDVVSVSAIEQPLALKTDGSLWAVELGMQPDGEVNIVEKFDTTGVYYEADYSKAATPTTSVKIMDGIVSVSGDMVLKADGSLWNWNFYPFDTYAITAKIMNNVAYMSLGVGGFGPAMILKTDGSLLRFTYHPHSQLGTSKDKSTNIMKGVKLPEPIVQINTASKWARKGITASIKKGFVPSEIQGYYKNVITRAEFCRMAVKWVEYALGKDINTIVAEQGISKRMKHTFSDTKDAAILAAYRLGITNGSVTPTSDKPGKFNPNGKFTRQEAATMIMKTCKVVGMDVSNVKDAKFKDINTASTWAVDAINFVSNNSIMQGTGNNNFDPKATFTREQSITTFNNIKYK